MKYEQPYGVSDPNASYINGNPAAGIQGSIPPAAAFENPMREIVAMIAGGGYTPSDSDLQQLLRAVRSQFANYCVDQGTLSNNYLAALNPPIITYLPGMPFRLLVKNTNTGTSSFDGGAGRFPVTRYGGANLSAGDMPANSIAELVWNQAQARFELMNYAGVGSGGSGPPTVTVSGLINVQVFWNSGTYTPTTGATKAFVFCTGGGASGACLCGGAGGGGAGATSIALVNLAGPPAITSVPVTVGAGGAAAGFVGNNLTVAGAPGGASSFGTYANAGGGLGATVQSEYWGSAGAGGAASAGLLLIPGGDGHSAAYFSGVSSTWVGSGGGSFWGGGGAAAIGHQVPGNAGRAYGAGGSGGFDAPSGAGAPGIILVMEF